MNDAFPDHRSAPPSELEFASEWEALGRKGPGTLLETTVYNPTAYARAPAGIQTVSTFARIVALHERSQSKSSLNLAIWRMHPDFR